MREKWETGIDQCGKWIRLELIDGTPRLSVIFPETPVGRDLTRKEAIDLAHQLLIFADARNVAEAKRLTDLVRKCNPDYSIRWNPSAVMLPVTEPDTLDNCTCGAFEAVTRKGGICYQRRTAEEIEQLFTEGQR